MTSATRTSETDPLRIAELRTGRGLVGVTLCPGKQGHSAYGGSWARSMEADLAAIVDWGASAVVTLIEEHEFGLLGVEALPRAVQAAGIEWHWLPIPDVDVPDGRFGARWVYAGARVRERLRAGERVLVHCRGGLGRAGMVAAGILVEFGMPPREAIAAVRRVRPGAIETAAQEAWVEQRQPVDANRDERRSRELACLLGGAIGDALGYRVEFQRWAEIKRAYGSAGIELAQAGGELVVSDDTQMTLFTLEGMTRASGLDEITGEINEAYLDWYGTQRRVSGARAVRGRLAGRAELCRSRAPGGTCLAALREGGHGSVTQAINGSKGCGGVMRTAPLGFLDDAVSDGDVFRLGAEAAALTHGHPEGFLPAGAMAVLVRDAFNGLAWDASVEKALELTRTWPKSEGTAAAIEAAVSAVADGPASREKVSALGEGWVGEEALAIGLYSALTAGNFAECVQLAANHDGDSDSTASIAGQLYAAKHGLGSLPAEAVYRLDVLEALLEVAGEWGQIEEL